MYDAVPLSPIEADYHHGDWPAERARIAAALRRAGTRAATVARFECCGSVSYVMCHKTDNQVRISATYCHHRLCRPCARRRAATVSNNLLAHLLTGPYAHVVLTLRSTDTPLTTQIDRLYKAFKDLRNLKLVDGRTDAPQRVEYWWDEHVSGGAAFFEATYNDKTASWHPHLHIIVESKWLPRDMLAWAWEHVTGDSTIVWVERIIDKDKAVAEAAKYITKALTPSVHRDPDALDELICALRGRRLAMCFGRWYGVKLSEPDPQFDPAEWYALCTLDDLVTRGEDGDLQALALLARLDAIEKHAPRPPPMASPRLFPRPH
jgi:hypothetical protein